MIYGQNTLAQMKWRLRAYDTIERAKCQLALGEINDKPWYLDENLKKSIMEVIGKAIADCVTGDNEFKNKKPGEVITFEGSNPWAYEQKNWNAVILYNYCFCKMKKQDYPTVLKK